MGILACESLAEYVHAAQKKLKTAYPVFILNYDPHEKPEQMRSHIAELTAQMPEEIDTVLVAMGFCGGAWNQLSIGRRTVIPRVDDCVSLLLNTDHTYHPNLKRMGHLYMTERELDPILRNKNRKRLCQQCPRWRADDCYRRWFGNHSHLDIVDTGVFDCYDENYVEIAQRCAEAVSCTLDYVPGSNLLMEKLIGGQWDEQFLMAEPGEQISHGDFF